MKYLLLRIRAKIAFIAFEKRMTVVELFVNTIFWCYTQLVDQGYKRPLTSEQ